MQRESIMRWIKYFAAVVVFAVALFTIRSSDVELAHVPEPNGQVMHDTRAAVRDLESLSLSFVGDLMAHPPNYNMSDYNRIYAHVGQLFLEDDLSFINLEYVSDPNRPMSGFPSFNVHPQYTRTAVDWGFDVFSTANNHINDFGWQGIRATRFQWYLLRAYALEEHRRPLYMSGLRSPSQNTGFPITRISYQGWNIGFLAVTGILNQYYSGTEEVFVVPYWDAEANAALIELVRRESPQYDLFILSYHGGNEYQLQPNRQKWRLFNALADAGADIIWGHHPHVLQPIEFYPRPEGNCGVIMYSMGNFVSSQPIFLSPSDSMVPRAYTGDSAIVQLSVRMTSLGADVNRIHVIPITHMREYDRSVRVQAQAEADDQASGETQTERVPSEGTEAQRDGYEVFFTRQAPDVANETWKKFYETRRDQMLRLIGPPSARYYQKTHPMP